MTPRQTDAPVESDPLLLQGGDNHGAIGTAPENGKSDGENGGESKTLQYGYCLMLSSAVMGSLMSFCVHVAESQHGFPSTSALVVRATISLSICAISANVEKPNFSYSPGTVYVFLLLQGFCGASGVLFTFLAQARLPVGICDTLLYTSPIITSVFAAVFLGDPFTRRKLVTLVINFAGVALVSTHSQDETEASSRWKFIFGVIFALSSATSFSMVYVLSRKMAVMNVHVLVRIISGASFMLLLGTAGTAHSILQHNDSNGDSQNATLASVVKAALENHQGLLFAVLSAFAGHVAQYCLHSALRFVSASAGSVIRSFSVPFSLLLGFFLLNERPSAVSLVGVLFVLSSVLLSSIPQSQHEKTRKETGGSSGSIAP